MRRLLTGLLFTLWLTAACRPITATPDAASEPSNTSTPAATQPAIVIIDSTRWLLTALETAGEETPVVPGTLLTLEFHPDGTVSGEGGCNGFGGQYQRLDEQLILRDIISTLRACANDEATQQEVRYLQMLSAVTHFTLDDEQLTLFSDDEVDVLYFVRLP